MTLEYTLAPYLVPKSHMLKYLSFPLILTAGTWIALANQDNEIIAVFVLVGLIVITLILERIIPYHKEWNEDRKDTLIDIMYFILAGVLVAPLVNVFVLWISKMLAIWFQDITEFSILPARTPILVSVIVVILVRDFIPYWIHRWAHESSDWLWKFHAIHHSPERVYSLNYARFHPINSGWNIFFGSLPCILLGLDPNAIFVAGVSMSIIQFLAHSNIDFRLGILNWVFSMNELHRWHHSKELKEANSNYGGNLIFWDIIFKTRFLPRAKMKASQVGLAGGENRFPFHSFIRQLVYPFRR